MYEMNVISMGKVKFVLNDSFLHAFLDVDFKKLFKLFKTANKIF